MAGKNGTAPTVEVHANPSGVFGRVPRALPFGDGEVTIRRLSNGEMKRQMTLLNATTWLPDEGSVGEQYYAGTSSAEKWDDLIAWLACWTEPVITAEAFDEATAEQTVALIDAIFEDGGLAWLRRSLGNRAAALLAALANMQQPGNSPLTDTNDSTLSTNSSSESVEPPPTPESTLPATG